MLPLIALIGRPNVGKSTLFNVLTKTRDALVADTPGLTRDRRYGECTINSRKFRITDTGGLLHDREEQIDREVDKQSRTAAQQADIIVFMLDGRDGLTAVDEQIAQELRKIKKPLIVAVNKADFADPNLIMADFYQLGLNPILAISAEHRKGINNLCQQIYKLSENLDLSDDDFAQEKLQDHQIIKLAVLGRPNAGKSTLLNRLLGEDRLVASPIAGTTRDSVFIPYKDQDGDEFLLIDTAGIRKKSRVNEKIEKFSIIKALDAVEFANVVMLILDAQREISDQDAHLLGEITRRGRGLIIAVNKWDNLPEEQKTQIKSDLSRKLHFIDYADIVYISALKGSNVKNLLPAVKKIHRNAFADLSSNELTEVIASTYRRHQPPLIQGKAVKFQYAHQGGKNPPHIIIHGSRTSFVPDSYTQYLIKYIRKHFNLNGTALRISYRDKFNPYHEK